MQSVTMPDPSDVARYPSSRQLSAVVIFSNIISSPNSKSLSSETSSPLAIPAVCGASTSESSFAGPGDLPTEILLLIFRFAFEACLECPENGTLSSEHSIVWLDDDPLSPSLFPYSLASVCTRWLHILSSIPAYWTRQVITVDSHAMPLIVAQTLLRWVAHLPLKLIITSDPGPSAETERDEHARVQDVLGILRPQIGHIWSLTFSVKYSSSVPAVWREKGDAQQLRSLTLMSATSGAADLPRLPDLLPAKTHIVRDNGPLVAHLLKEVTLGGYFFNDALSLGKQRHHWFSSITSFTIRSYTTINGTPLSLYGFVSTLQTCLSLQRLTVEDVAFVNDVHASYRYRLEASVVRIHKVTDEEAFATLISQSLGTRLKEKVTVTECPFDNFGIRNLFRTNLPSVNLTLDSIDAGCSAMEKLICFWNGENLSLVNCPGLSGSFMRGVPTVPPRLRRVRVVDCENASASGLISWVKSREIQAEIDAIIPGEFDTEPCLALVELQVNGRGPSIGKEQALWLSQHLDNFTWNTVTRDGVQYTWDGFARKLVILPANCKSLYMQRC